MLLQSYSDQLTRRTMAVFYGQVKDETFRRQMKENRKIEELILMFATNATNVLKKEPSLAGDGWKVELNIHIAHFIRLLGECLRNVSHVSPELTARLDQYAAKLAPAQAPSDSGYDSSSTSRDRDSVIVPKRVSASVSDMPLVMTAGRLFKLPDTTLQKEVDDIGKYCSEKVRDSWPDSSNIHPPEHAFCKAALTDLKVSYVPVQQILLLLNELYRHV